MEQEKSPRLRFGIRFSLLARRWRRVLDGRLAASGMTGATWFPLIHLQETRGGLSQKDLAVLVGVDGSSLVRVLDILERDGLIERRRDDTDGRARLIFLTAEGDERVKAVRAELAMVEAELLADLPDGILAEMQSQFDKIDQRLAEFEEQNSKVTK